MENFTRWLGIAASLAAVSSVVTLIICIFVVVDSSIISGILIAIAILVAVLIIIYSVNSMLLKVYATLYQTRMMVREEDRVDRELGILKEVHKLALPAGASTSIPSDVPEYFPIDMIDVTDGDTGGVEVLE